MDIIKKNDLYHVYMLTNKVNGKVYIGQTKAKVIKQRFYQHRNGRSGSPKITNAFNKYGKYGFKFEVVATALSATELDIIESSLIALYNSTDDKYGYNIQFGGNGANTHSEETKRIISQSNKGRKLSGNTKEKLKKAWDKQRRKNVSDFNKKTKSKKIYKYDFDGNLIQAYPSLRSAARDIGGAATNIYDVARGKYRSYKGYQWEYFKKDKIKPYEKYNPTVNLPWNNQ